MHFVIITNSALGDHGDVSATGRWRLGAQPMGGVIASFDYAYRL